MDWFDSVKNQLLATIMDTLKQKADELIEKTVTKATDIIGICIAVFFMFFAFSLFMLFAGVGVALLISEWTGKVYTGFLILAVVYLFFGWLFWVLRKKLISNLLKRIIMKSTQGN